jgi:hypothetical protein
MPVDPSIFNNVKTYQDYANQQRQLDAANQSAQLDAISKQSQIANMLIGSSVDQPSYDLARAKLQRFGIDTSQFPEQFDTNIVSMARYGGATPTAQLNALITQQRLALDAGKATGDVTGFGYGGLRGGIPTPTITNQSGALTSKADQMTALFGGQELGEPPPAEAIYVQRPQMPQRSYGETDAAYNARPDVIAAKKRAEIQTESAIAGEQALSPIDQIKAINEKAFDAPYMDNLSKLARISPFEAQRQKAMQMDLLRQARTDLAAPLAKQLGVNPTDRDFQASLDRIFDISSSKESRAAQLMSLEQRIIDRMATNPYAEKKDQRLDFPEQNGNTPKPGSVVTGDDGDYMFNGGNPADPNSWKKVR